MSPSFAAPGKFPEVFELGLKRLRDIFKLEPVEFSTTRKISATTTERAQDLIRAFEDQEIKAVIASIGGDDQVTYIKNLSPEPFVNNPKPFFGYSDNTHFANFLWLNGIPSFYGGSVMTQLAMQNKMNDFDVAYLKKAFFESGEFAIESAKTFTDDDLDWGDVENLSKKRTYEENEAWFWDGSTDVQGIIWGGCLESIDELLRNNITIPTLKQFGDVILIIETAEDVPSHNYVKSVCRALGERGILERVNGILVGRPKARALDKQVPMKERQKYREDQRDKIIKTVRAYNKIVPIIQNLDFGHTDPQIPMPYGNVCRIDASSKKILIQF